ncbi:MAG: PEP-CTERM sorting domain-containing protein [Planctomycetia bacterium]|nr:PEP-CTERM sorting domain-containing protein [Planctomycetia bacterium]
MNAKFWKVLGWVCCLTLPCVAETITGSRTISGDYTPSDNYMIVGTATTSGEVHITGGTTTLSSGTEVAFRDQLAGLLITNGTVTVSNARITTTTNGVYANAPAGSSATLIINDGGYVYSAGYPGIAADFGTTGTLLLNSGGTFESSKSFYCAGHGVGTVNLNGGLLKINANGLHIGRDYESNIGGSCEGYFNMTSGTLDVGTYCIIGRNNLDDSTHTNIGEFNMSGGTATIGSTFNLAVNAKNVRHDLIRGIANIGNGTEIAKLTVQSHFNIGNGEGSTRLGSSPADGTLNVYNNAEIHTGLDVAAGTTAKAAFFGIGSTSSLNLYGGSLTAHGTLGAANAGTINLAGGTLTFADTVTSVSNQGTLNAKSGTLTATQLTNTGTVNFNGSGATMNAVLLETGTTNISSGENVFNQYVQVGNATTAGTLNITGGTTTLLGGYTTNFRGDKAGLLVYNGKVTLTNTTLNTGDESAIFVDAPAGCTAELVIGKGAVVTSNAPHPSAGAEAGTTGTITIDGGSFTTTESMYIGGNGIGYLNVNSGFLQVKGLQVARDYHGNGNSASGNCEGYVNITGGEVKATSYIIISHGNLAGSTHPTYAELNMSGDAKLTSGSYFCLAANYDNYSDKSMVQGVANFRDQSTLAVGTQLGIGNGENQTRIVTGGTATFNVYDNATITVNGYTGINSASELNLYGGSLQANGNAANISLENAGKIQLSGGDLMVAKNLKNSGSIQFVNGLRGFGSLTVGGNLENAGTLLVSSGSGLGLVEGYDVTDGVTVMNVTGTVTEGTITTDGSIASAKFSGGNLVVKLAGSEGSLNAVSGNLTLTTPTTAGFVSLTGFTGSDPFNVRLTFDGIDSAAEQAALQALLVADLKLGDDSLVDVELGDAVNELNVTGLRADLLTANTLSWNFLAEAYRDMNVALSGIGMQQVPEPSAILLILGMLLGMAGLRKRNR